MILCAGENVLLLMFEILACYKLDTNSDLLWSLVFVPLFSQSILSVVICVWAIRRERSFEFEMFFSVNVLQIAFLAMKMDRIVYWDWVIIFIPLWILICLSLIGVLYAVILAVLLIRSIELLPEHRRQHVYTAISYTFLVIPILIFLVLLTSRLDGGSSTPYVIICSPLYVSLICLMFMACCTKGGSSWWFGIRRDFCWFLLDTCPCLQEYGNVSYNRREKRYWNSRRESEPRNVQDAVDSVQLGNNEGLPAALFTAKDLKPVCTVVTIESPD